MNDSDHSAQSPASEHVVAELVPPVVGAAPSPDQQQLTRREARRWWIKLFIQPALLLACGVILIVGLGLAQKLGFLADGRGGQAKVPGAAGTRYICPMMCTPPQNEPGRCPVCAMELVAATDGSSQAGARTIVIDPASRRIANIQTAAVASLPMTRTIRTIGELRYDEGTLKTISAYVDGRLERLYADYTGVVVTRGDQLALLYSPRLYSGQVELLTAQKSRDDSRSSTLQRVFESNQDLYVSAKQRLIELGRTESQIQQLEQDGEANSRLHLFAPSSGTVIEKLAVEGQYVKEGDAIYRLADLSTVWLMLELFPADASSIRFGQRVEAEVQSLEGRTVTGRVVFIDPNVDPETRTVGVRVVIPNPDGLLRVGDYAKATMKVSLSDARQSSAYDPELANKWISPRHPHVIAESAGICPVCGIDLVPASQFGFTDEPGARGEVLVVPRDAVLMAGSHSVVYVETVAGRFEIRRVVLGPIWGDQAVILSGVALGEQVATRGNFLIDSQMQLAGNPSLIDPTRLESTLNELSNSAVMTALSGFSPEDLALIDQQRICPVREYQLGSMGAPSKVDVNGTPVFICCNGCRAELLAEPDKYLAKLSAASAGPAARTKEERATPDGVQPAGASGDLPPIGVPQRIPADPAGASTIQGGPQGAHGLRPAARQTQEAFGEAAS